MNSNMKKRKIRSTQAQTSGFGQAVIASLRGWERGEPVTTRHVKRIPQPRQLTPQQVRKLRTQTLNVSQSVFASLLGVSVKLVEAWEAGRNQPAAPVRRLFEVISRNPQEFLRTYAKGAA
jgi:putative transcriptional regulator